MGLTSYISRRLVQAAVVLLLVSVVTFAISQALPGDPIDGLLSERQADNPEVRKALEERWGLDKPVYVQYGYYMKGLFQGDLGESIRTRHPVTEDLSTMVPATIELATGAMLFAILFGVPLGILAAIRQNTWIDHTSRFLALIGTSIPVFWLGLLMLYVFFYRLSWLPGPGQLDIGMQKPPEHTGFISIDAIIAGDWDVFYSFAKHLILPSIVLGAYAMGIVQRMLRSSLLTSLSDDYVRTARAKGLAEREVVTGHALRNAMIPTVTVLGLTAASLLAGAVLTETIFSWPGVGNYAALAAFRRDYPALLGTTFIVAVGYILINLFVDILYGFLDPRIRIG